MAHTEKIQIANMGLIASSQDISPGETLHSPFYSQFSKFKTDSFSNYARLFDLKIFFHKKVSEKILSNKITFKTPAWDLHRDKKSLYFVLYFTPEKKKINQVLQANLYDNSAVIYCEGVEGNMIFHPLEQILFQWGFSKTNAFMLHGSAFEINGRGFIALAQSTGGKTTLLKTLKKNSSKIKILNDEKNVIWKWKDGGYFLSSTPWHGEIETFSQATIPLDSIFYIKRTSKNELTRINLTEACVKTLQTYFMPIWSGELMRQNVESLEKMLSNKMDRLFSLSFVKESDVYSLIVDNL